MLTVVFHATVRCACSTTPKWNGGSCMGPYGERNDREGRRQIVPRTCVSQILHILGIRFEDHDASSPTPRARTECNTSWVCPDVIQHSSRRNSYENRVLDNDFVLSPPDACFPRKMQSHPQPLGYAGTNLYPNGILRQ
jgi:hypothetical protein